MLKVEGLRKQLGGRRILDGIELTCEASEAVVIAGPNGAGKSTLLRVICGMLDADSGDVQICGHSMRRDDLRAKALLGYVPDGLDSLPDLLVSEFVTLVRTLKRISKGAHSRADDACAERFGVTPFWGQRLRALSFGQRKRAALVAALSGSPWLLVLDEPTNGLDGDGVELIRRLIDERTVQGRATLLSTNDAAFGSSLRASQYRLQEGKLMRVTGAAISASL